MELRKVPKAFKGSLRYSAMQEECNWGGCNTGLQKTSTSTNPYSFQRVLQGPHMWFTTEIISGFGPRYTILRCLQRGVKNNTRLTSIPKEQSLVALILIIIMTTKTPQFSHSRESLQSSVRQVLDVTLRTRVSTRAPLVLASSWSGAGVTGYRVLLPHTRGSAGKVLAPCVRIDVFQTD